MLQVQLLVPSVDIDATLTANMRRGQDLELALKSEVKFMEIASEQQIKLNYGMAVFANIKNVHLCSGRCIKHRSQSDHYEITLF